jgi:hypothetical protein
MSKLSSDNPDTMPITDAVYGKQPRHRGEAKEPRGHTSELWRTIPYSTFRALVKRGTKATGNLRRSA